MQVAVAQVVGDVVVLRGFFGLVIVFGIIAAQDDAFIVVLVKIKLHVKVLKHVEVYHKFHFFHGMNELAIVQEQVGLLAVGEGFEEGWCQHKD
jgi:hypothetical protein